MADKPIIFSAPMVRALLDGRKTQTRRVLKLPTKTHSGGPIYERKDMGGWEATTIGGGGCFTLSKSGERVPTPERPAIWHQTTGVTMGLPYAPGDRLYVREAFSYETLDVDRNGFMPPWYWADGNPVSGDFTRPKPSIHMPRWASRLTLTVTEVRVQRLWQMTNKDAIAEGIKPQYQQPAQQGGAVLGWGYDGLPGYGPGTPKAAFAALWNRLHGPDAWAENPWVVALTFTVARGNIDAGAA